MRASDCAASHPRTDSPFATRAPGQSFAMSASLRPMPLPSLVQKGAIVLPERSKLSKKVNSAIGMVPHQLG